MNRLFLNINIDWDKFHFIRAEYLKYSIPVLIIILLGIFLYSEKIKWKSNIAEHLRPYMIKKGTEWRTRLMHIMVLVLFVIGFVSFLGPTWKKHDGPSKKVTSRMVIALDLSQSMLAEDISPNRLERAKFKIHDFLKSKPNAETTLLGFAASTHIIVPFTTDYKIILDNLDGLKPSMMPVKGTSFEALFDRVDSLFTDNIAPGKLLIFTDDLDGISIELISSFMQHNDVQIMILPFATKSGTTIPTGYKKNVFKNDKGAIVNSALNKQIAQSLSAINNVNIVDITLDESDVKDLAKSISNSLIFEDNEKQKDEDWEDQGYWLLIPLIIMFLLTFRKGWALYSTLLIITLSSCSKETKENTFDLKFADLWYTKEYQAQKEYNAANYAVAAQQFEDPMHKGVSYYKSGDYLSAEIAFKQDSSTQSLYNLGLTYAKLGRLEESQKVFEEVIQRDANFAEVKNNLNEVSNLIEASDTIKTEDIPLDDKKQRAKNKQNDSPEDLSGGGQKATEKDMQKERKEETQETGMRKGKELEELPDDMTFGKEKRPQNILMRKVDDDPALFLTRKFKYQIKKKQVTAKKTNNTW